MMIVSYAAVSVAVARTQVQKLQRSISFYSNKNSDSKSCLPRVQTKLILIMIHAIRYMIEYMIDDNKLVKKLLNTKYRRHIKKIFTVINNKNCFESYKNKIIK